MSDERMHDAFETWVKETGAYTDWSRFCDSYAKPLVAHMWRAWRASAALAAQQDRAWQPIETIPEEFKDRRRFLARTADFEHGCEFNVRVQEGRWTGRTPDDPVGHFGSSNGQMVTHWMPMPAEPTRLEQNAGEGKGG